MPNIQIHLAHTQGFCAGVNYALTIVDDCLIKYGAPVYVLHEIVHNSAVVARYTRQGVVFVDDLADIPAGQVVVFSAHGVAPAIYESAHAHGLRIVDASCPLVKKVHREAEKFSRQGIPVILIGHKGHQEMIGTAGYVRPDLLSIIEKETDIPKLTIPRDGPVAYLTQTTLSVSGTRSLIQALSARFPKLVGPAKSDICYATQVRQDAVIELAESSDLMIICGSPNSSNSNRLRDTAEQAGVESLIIDSSDELDMTRLIGKTRVGLSSGASVPADIVAAVIARIQQHYPDAQVFQPESQEHRVQFTIPELPE